MGKEGIACKIYELNPRSEQLANSEAIPETKPNIVLKPTDTQQSKEYRVHNLNATRPSQVQLLQETPQQNTAMAGLATIPNVSNMDGNHLASSIVDDNGEVKPTVERKRHVSPTIVY